MLLVFVFIKKGKYDDGMHWHTICSPRHSFSQYIIAFSKKNQLTFPLAVLAMHLAKQSWFGEVADTSSRF